MRYYIDVMDHDDGEKSFHVCNGGQSVAVIEECLFDDRAGARAAAEMVRTALTEHNDRRNGKLSANANTSYAQIEAIHEAMRECEFMLSEETISYEHAYSNKIVVEKDDLDRCFAKIRAALAGEKVSNDGSP